MLSVSGSFNLKASNALTTLYILLDDIRPKYIIGTLRRLY